MKETKVQGPTEGHSIDNLEEFAKGLQRLANETGMTAEEFYRQVEPLRRTKAEQRIVIRPFSEPVKRGGGNSAKIFYIFFITIIISLALGS